VQRALILVSVLMLVTRLAEYALKLAHYVRYEPSRLSSDAEAVHAFRGRRAGVEAAVARS
jgi:hypothetical protein